jgi:hypothetical protein
LHYGSVMGLYRILWHFNNLLAIFLSNNPHSGLPRGVPQRIPWGVPRGLPWGDTLGTPWGIPRGVAQGLPRGIPWATPRGYPDTPRGIPRGIRGVRIPWGIPGRIPGTPEVPGAFTLYQSLPHPQRFHPQDVRISPEGFLDTLHSNPGLKTNCLRFAIPADSSMRLVAGGCWWMGCRVTRWLGSQAACRTGRWVAGWNGGLVLVCLVACGWVTEWLVFWGWFLPLQSIKTKSKL